MAEARVYTSCHEVLHPVYTVENVNKENPSAVQVKKNRSVEIP
jgi:hypothetical protein